MRVKGRNFMVKNDNNYDAGIGSPKWKVMFLWYKKTKYSYFRWAISLKFMDLDFAKG